jgi:hypothetical protein
MKWSSWYVTKSYFRSALWIVPLLSLVAEQVTIRAVGVLDIPDAWLPQGNRVNK